MSTPLMWKSMQLSQSVYDRFMYPHLATLVPSTETVFFELCFQKRIPFHLSSCAHIAMLSCVFHFLARCFLELNFRYIYITPFYVGLAVFIIMHLLLVSLYMLMGDQGLKFLNYLLKFERELLGNKMKPVGYATKIGHYPLLFKGMYL